MTYALIPMFGPPVLLHGAFTDLNGTKHPANVLQLWSDGELAAIGVHKVEDPDPLPPGRRSTGMTVVDQGDRLKWVHTLADEPLADLKAAKLAQLAARRWDAEQWITYLGVRMKCDVAARANVTGTILGMQLPGAKTNRRWKLESGDHRDMAIADMIAMGRAMGDHVQACFDHEEALAGQIAAATDAAQLEAVNINSGWPE